MKRRDNLIQSEVTLFAERLTTADPGNADWQRILAISHEKIGPLVRNVPYPKCNGCRARVAAKPSCGNLHEHISERNQIGSRMNSA